MERMLSLSSRPDYSEVNLIPVFFALVSNMSGFLPPSPATYDPFYVCRCPSFFVSGLLLVMSHAMAVAQETKPVAPVDKPKTASVSTGSIQSEATFNVNFAPAEASEISVDLKVLTTIKIEEVVPHGASVKEGDTLVRFDTESLNEQIEAQERLVASLRLSMEEAEREAKLIQMQLPLDKEQAELTKQQADEDYRFYLEFDKSFAERSNDHRLKSSKDFVDYSAEEIKQLEKMYKADDLTEESEEIVLRRARDDLERQKFSFEQAEQTYRRTKELSLPRTQRDRKNAHRLAEIAWERFQLTHPLTMEKREQTMAKSRQELNKANKTLEQLLEDLKACEVKSPRSGLVYYGRVQSGKWVGIAEGRAKLKKYGSITSHDVFLTVVSPDRLQLVGNVAETDVDKLRVGGVGKLTPTMRKNERLDVAVRSISPVPVGDGQFEVTLDLKSSNKDFVPGMTGSVRLVTYYNPVAMTLPSNVVLTDELDDTIRYVNVLSAEDKPVRKNVEVGMTQGDRIEIRAGVGKSDKILVEKPKAE